MRELHCSCGNILAKAIDAEDYTIKGKVVIVQKGQTFTICKGCNKKVPVSIKDLMESKNPKLFVNK